MFTPYFPFGIDHDAIRIIILFILGVACFIRFATTKRGLFLVESFATFALSVCILYQHCAVFRCWLRG